MINLFKSKILTIQQHTGRLKSFEIEIPTNVEWSFIPGQYIDVAFPDEPNKFSGFSLTSTSHDKFISISVQKTPEVNASHNMFLLNPGDEIIVRGPAGDFTLDCNQIHHIVLIAGGIGVTPLISMFRTASRNSSGNEVFFFHSAKNQHELLFHNEFEQLAKINPQITYFTTVTQQGNWNGKKERFTVRDVINKLDETNLTEYHFYICGPGEMNADFRKGLKNRGINESNIHIESYYEP